MIAFAPDGPRELLPGYAELLRFCRQARVLTYAEAARLNAQSAASQKSALREAIELREMLARVCYGWFEGKSSGGRRPASLAALGGQVHAASGVRWRGGRLAWEWKSFRGVAETACAVAGAGSSRTFSPLMNHRSCMPCASNTCRWLFLDTSKNRTRRWCDMKICGNRAKARRYSAAHRH